MGHQLAESLEDGAIGAATVATNEKFSRLFLVLRLFGRSLGSHTAHGGAARLWNLPHPQQYNHCTKHAYAIHQSTPPGSQYAVLLLNLRNASVAPPIMEPICRSLYPMHQPCPARHILVQERLRIVGGCVGSHQK
jgi:hypothetical protein